MASINPPAIETNFSIPETRKSNLRIPMSESIDPSGDSLGWKSISNISLSESVGPSGNPLGSKSDSNMPMSESIDPGSAPPCAR